MAIMSIWRPSWIFANKKNPQIIELGKRLFCDKYAPVNDKFRFILIDAELGHIKIIHAYIQAIRAYHIGVSFSNGCLE